MSMDRIELDTLQTGESIEVSTNIGKLTFTKTNVDTNHWAKLWRMSDNVEVDGSGNPVNMTQHLFVVSGSDKLREPRRLPKIVQKNTHLMIGPSRNEMTTLGVTVTAISKSY